MPENCGWEGGREVVGVRVACLAAAYESPHSVKNWLAMSGSQRNKASVSVLGAPVVA
jgi:hypothetical protein